MALNLVTTGNTVLAADINQLVNVLQRSAGQTETGDYYITGNSGVSNGSVGYWVPSLSRVATPVSVTIDQTLQSGSGFGTPGTDHLNSSGFHVYANTTTAIAAANVGGAYTIQY